MEQSTINHRIKKLVEELDGGNKLAFSKRVGMSNQGLGEIIGDRQSNPSYPNLVKMLRNIPQVRMEWLLLGEGEMLHSGVSLTQPQHSDEIAELQTAIAHKSEEYAVKHSLMSAAKDMRDESEKLIEEAYKAVELDTEMGRITSRLCHSLSVCTFNYYDLLRSEAQAVRMHLASLHYRLSEALEADIDSKEQTKKAGKEPPDLLEFIDNLK